MVERFEIKHYSWLTRYRWHDWAVEEFIRQHPNFWNMGIEEVGKIRATARNRTWNQATFWQAGEVYPLVKYNTHEKER